MILILVDLLLLGSATRVLQNASIWEIFFPRIIGKRTSQLNRDHFHGVLRPV